jgi:hypothetical protein
MNAWGPYLAPMRAVAPGADDLELEQCARETARYAGMPADEIDRAPWRAVRLTVEILESQNEWNDGEPV